MIRKANLIVATQNNASRIAICSIWELSEESFKSVMTSSPHHIGLPEVLELAKVLGISFLKEIKIEFIELPYNNSFKFSETIVKFALRLINMTSA